MNLRRILSAFVLATTVAAIAPACVVSGTARMRGTVAYSQPPPPQEEAVEYRSGYVWIHGRWDYQGDQWVWVNGRWEQERQGYQYSEGQWVQRGSSWHWVEGNWVAVGATGNGGTVISNGNDNVIVNDATDANGGVVVTDRPRGDGRNNGNNGNNGGRVVHDRRGNGGGGYDGSGINPSPAPGNGMYPTAPPPAPRQESYQSRDGYLWVSGRWDWRGGRWEWLDGHWERERANRTWAPGRWELQGNYYIWIEGSWR